MRLHSEWALPNIIGGNHKINREGGSQSRFEAKTAMDAPVKIPKASLPGPLSAASPRPEHGCDALTRRRRWRSCSRWPRLLCYSARLDILCQFEECSGIGYTNVCCRDFQSSPLCNSATCVFFQEQLAREKSMSMDNLRKRAGGYLDLPEMLKSFAPTWKKWCESAEAKTVREVSQRKATDQPRLSSPQ